MRIRISLLLIPLMITTMIQAQHHDHGKVKTAGTMQDVMWQGQLEPVILLDSITPIDGLYAIGPLAGLRGEILVLNGERYISRVISDDEMTVKVEGGAGAPFLVYAHVDKWSKVNIPDDIANLDGLNEYLDKVAATLTTPFVFQVKGTVEEAGIHIQKLPHGAKVQSPDDAHIGQFNYNVGKEDVVIIGFYSTEHQGVFTHHDSHTHMHLITDDRVMMGHLDDARFEPESLEFFVAD